MGYKKAFIETHVLGMIDEVSKHMKEKLKILFDSGAIDIESYDTENNRMVLPKCIISALLESEIQQYSGHGTSFEKRNKKEIRNLRYFI